MKLGELLISFRHTKKSAMSQEISGVSEEQVCEVAKPNRELAWKIAPNLIISFKYAWAGVNYAFHTQRNFRIHIVIGTLAINLAVFLGLQAIEIAVIALTIAFVLAMELLNTALESVVDLTVKQSYHELAKIAKDCAAAAVLVSAIASILVAGSLLLPPLIALIRTVVQ